MKKVLLLLVTLAMLVTSLTGCTLFKKNDNVITDSPQVNEVSTDNNQSMDTTNVVKENEEKVDIPTDNATTNVVYTETPTKPNTPNVVLSFGFEGTTGLVSSTGFTG